MLDGLRLNHGIRLRPGTPTPSEQAATAVWRYQVSLQTLCVVNWRPGCLLPPPEAQAETGNQGAPGHWPQLLWTPEKQHHVSRNSSKVVTKHNNHEGRILHFNININPWRSISRLVCKYIALYDQMFDKLIVLCCSVVRYEFRLFFGFRHEVLRL